MPIKVSYSTDSWSLIGDDLAGWDRGQVLITPGPGNSVDVPVTLVVKLVEGQYRYVELHAEDITSKLLRSFSLRDAEITDEFHPRLLGVAWRLLMPVGPKGKPIMMREDDEGNRWGPLDIPKPRNEGSSDAALKDVALIYRVAEIGRTPPVQEIARLLEMPRATAAGWVKLARAAGHLPRIER